MDIFWWLASTGRLARTIDEVRDAAAARHEPSMQLTGRRPVGEGSEVDLRALQSRGVRLVGRFAGMDGSRARFRPDLAHNVAIAERRMHGLLDSIDEYIARTGLTAEVLAPHRPRPLDVPSPTPDLDLFRADINTVVVATGYRPDYPWLRLPITTADGAIRQYRGITPADGVYVVGQRFQHRRDSGFIHGARHDAQTVVRHLVSGAPSAARDEPTEEPAA
jgi:putative flavoprotein involved in K+ transport